MSAASAPALTLKTDLTYPLRQCLGEVLGDTNLIPVNPLLDMIASYLIPSLCSRLTHDEVITTTLVPMPEGAAELRVNRGGHVFFTLTRANGEMCLLLMEIAERVTTRVLRPSAVAHPDPLLEPLLFYNNNILKRDNEICVASNTDIVRWTIGAGDTLSSPEQTPLNSGIAFPKVAFFDYDERYQSLIVGYEDGCVQSIGRYYFTCKTWLLNIRAVLIVSFTEDNQPTLIVSTNSAVHQWSASTGIRSLILTPYVSHTRTDTLAIFTQAASLHTIDLTPTDHAPHQHNYVDRFIRDASFTTTCLWTLLVDRCLGSWVDMWANKFEIEMRLGSREIPLFARFIPSVRINALFGSGDTLVIRTVGDGQFHVVNFKKAKPKK